MELPGHLHRRAKLVIRVLAKAVVAHSLSFAVAWLLNRMPATIHRAGVSVLDPPTMTALSEFIRGAAFILIWTLLFRRDMRMVARFLGRPMRSSIALFSVACSASASMLLLGTSLSFNLSQTEALGPTIASSVEKLGSSPLATFLLSDRILKVFTICVVTPIIEETLFRCALFLLFLRILGKWPALLITSALFGVGHIRAVISHGLSCEHLLYAGWIGLVAGLFLILTHRLRWCILFHSLSNGFKMFMYFIIARGNV